MIKNNKRIEIVRSSVKGLSSMSQVSCDGILAVLSSHFTDVRTTLVNSKADLEMLLASKPDLVFLGMEFIPADPSLGLFDENKIWLSEVLDNHGIAYTGSRRKAHELGRYKQLAKQCVINNNLNTSAFCVVGKEEPINSDTVPIKFPLFVKPTNRGGGLGVDSDSLVHNFNQLLSKVRSINDDLSTDALIEEYLPGREFSVAILKQEILDEYMVMPIELIAPIDKLGSRILSGQVKSSNCEQVIAVSDAGMISKIITLALEVFHALGARDYGRIDIRLDESGEPNFLEVNLIPSLISGYGSFPKACVLNAGLEYEQMIVQIANLGLAHNMSSSGATSISHADQKIFTTKEV